jgi:hypothetical protein
MIGRPTGRLGHDAVEPELTQVDRIHGGVDHAGRGCPRRSSHPAMPDTTHSDCDLNLKNAPSDSAVAVEGILPSACLLTQPGSGAAVLPVIRSFRFVTQSGLYPALPAIAQRLYYRLTLR